MSSAINFSKRIFLSHKSTLTLFVENNPILENYHQKIYVTIYFSIFRQVSKVLSPNSLILKIWLAWDEEQPNVMFSVKRIKNDKRSSTTSNTIVQSSLETNGQDARSRKTVKRRNSSKIGTGSKQALDTVHPR